MCSHPPVRSIRKPRRLVLETLAYMGWRLSREALLHILQPKCVSWILRCLLLLKYQMQIRFSLSSSSVFSRSDLVTDSERFYNSLLQLLYDPEEQEEVNDLLLWWNRQEPFWNQPVLLVNLKTKYRIIFPAYSSARRPITTNSALSRIKERRARLKAAAAVLLRLDRTA